MNTLAHRLIVPALLLGVLYAAPAAAGPWTPERFGYYAQASVGLAGAEKPSELNLKLYGEFGLLDSLGVIASLPLQFDLERDARPDAKRVRFDPTIGLRWRFIPGPLVVAAQLDVKLPVSGSVEVTPQLLAGAGIGVLNGFFQVGAGYRFRYGNADEVVATADVGVWPTRRLLVIANAALRIQTGPEPGATLAEREVMLGGQVVWRTGPRVDLGIDVRTTIPTASVSGGIKGTFYVALRGGRT